MPVVFKIAWRYFFSKSGQTVINRINAIALLVIVVATAALMIVLSAFSGLKDFGLSFSNAFDPDLRVMPRQGKTITIDSNQIQQLEKAEGIKARNYLIKLLIFRFQKHLPNYIPLEIQLIGMCVIEMRLLVL